MKTLAHKTLSNVSSKYGAPMGRTNSLPDNTSAPTHLYAKQLRFIDGDYDCGGAYWGCGNPIFWLYGEDEENQIELFVRATSFEDAVNQSLEMLPNATFESVPELLEETLEAFLDAYIECALWSSNDESESPLDTNYCRNDISPATLEGMKADCLDFLTANAENLAKAGDASQNGHDFWLSRNGHGAGFFDRGYGKVGKELQTAAKVYGSVDLYAGDDGMIYA